MEDSYVEYNTSLVFACLQDPSPGCSLTIALWAQLPEYNTYLFSTSKGISDNSGIAITFYSQVLKITCLSASTRFTVIGPSLVPDGWTHIAIAYQNMEGTPDAELFINFEAVPVNIRGGSRNRFNFVPEAFMASGYQEAVGDRGFGVIDELLIFPEYLSASQIEQLKDSSD